MTRGHHRTDIQALRAAAIAVAIVFHAHLGLPGGFISVDVFFALSGFLITGLLLDEQDRYGAIRLLRFYARRVRRLLPAAALVGVAVVLGSWLLLDPLSARAATDAAAWSSTYLANVRFVIEELDYFGATLSSSPLLHYWSLSVEEQFYALWPLLLTGAAVISRRRRALAVLLAVLAVASLVHAEFVVRESRTVAYYSTLTRAWEFAIGAGGAVLVRRWPARWPAPGRWWAALGLAMVLVPLALYDAATPAPGLRTVPVVVGTVLILLPGSFRDESPFPRLTDGALTQRLGDISYSLYLWHWPLLVWQARIVDAPGPVARVGVLLVAVALADLTFRYVEDPLRSRGAVVRRARKETVLAGLTGSVLLSSVAALAVVAVPISEGSVRIVTDTALTRDELADVLEEAVTSPGPLPTNVTPPLDEAAEAQPRTYEDGCHNNPHFEELAERCTYGDGTRSPIVLLGDSHAAHWFPALLVVGDSVGRPVVNVTLAGCGFLDLPVYRLDATSEWTHCRESREQALENLAAIEAEVFVIAHADAYDVHDLVREPAPEEATLPDDRDARQAAGLRRLVERLHEARPDARVVVLGPLPVGSSDGPAPRTPACLLVHPEDVATCAAPVTDAVPDRVRTLHSGAALAGGADIWVDTTPFVCSRDACPALVGRTLVTYDASHLTRSYTKLVAPALLERIRDVVT